jgi:hypothetical protein
MSNILSVFNPPPGRDLSDEEVGKGCIGCTAIQGGTAIALGAYMALGAILKPLVQSLAKQSGTPVVHPTWWKATIRSGGAFLVVFGAVRVAEAWSLYRDSEDENKSLS